MAYRFVPFPTTLNDLESHSPVDRAFQVQFDEHLCDILQSFNRHGVSRGHSASAIAEFLVKGVCSDN